MIRSTFKLITSLFLLVFLCQYVFADALKIPPQPENYVNDYARMLTAGDVATLNQTLRHFEQQTSNQIVVATFNSLQGEPLEEFSVHLAQAWKVGSKQHDNGVLLLIIKDSHDIRIEVGYGLEGVLTDAISSMIIHQNIVPNFQQGQYGEGIKNGVRAIMQATQGEYKGTGEVPRQTNNAIFYFIFLIVALHFISAGFRYQRLRGTPADHGLRTFLWLLLLSNGSWFGRRGGGDDEGGFRGGGGSFGGGGASGKW